MKGAGREEDKEGSEDKRTTTKGSREEEGDRKREREERKEHNHKLITLIFLTSVVPTDRCILC